MRTLSALLVILLLVFASVFTLSAAVTISQVIEARRDQERKETVEKMVAAVENFSLFGRKKPHVESSHPPRQPLRRFGR